MKGRLCVAMVQQPTHWHIVVSFCWRNMVAQVNTAVGGQVLSNRQFYGRCGNQAIASQLLCTCQGLAGLCVLRKNRIDVGGKPHLGCGLLEMPCSRTRIFARFLVYRHGRAMFSVPQGTCAVFIVPARHFIVYLCALSGTMETRLLCCKVRCSLFLCCCGHPVV